MSSVNILYSHIIFVVKYRKKLLSNDILIELRYIFQEICSDCDVELIECNGEADHIHLMVKYKPSIRLSDLIFRLKGISSRKLKQKYPYLGRHLWTPSYFVASCGGAPIEIIKEYIQNQ